eukprot:Skav215695  [mRNA]  locus=scaffold3538:33758:68487:+ [translate_table: standard]
MPEPTADEIAAAAAEMSLTFDQQDLREKLWALAERRPADASKLMGQAFAGKKSLGEMASAPQTSDPNLKSAPPREFLNNTVVNDLAPALAQAMLGASATSSTINSQLSPVLSEAETAEAISVRQKLIVLRENLKTRAPWRRVGPTAVSSHPEDATAFLQLVGVHSQLGEALVLSGRCGDGCEVLQEVLDRPDTGFHAMAWASSALAHALRHRYASALNCCREVVRSCCRCKEALDLGHFLEAWCHYRCSELATAQELARSSLAREPHCKLRERLWGLLCRVEADAAREPYRVLNGNLMAAEHCYHEALSHEGCIDTRMAGAVLRMVQMQWDDAEEILQEALNNHPSEQGCDSNCPEALLLQAQLLLRVLAMAAGLRLESSRQEIQQPTVTDSARSSIVACADAESLTALLRKRGLAIELSLEEASLLRDCALTECGDPCDPAALPKLVGTASTAMPASDNPSRQNSDSALPVCDFKDALTMEGVAKMLGSERLIAFDDLEFGELLSRGEHTTVQKARYKGSPVVVKALHHQAIMYNQDAVEDLLAEIRILTKLSHPRLVPLVGACLEEQEDGGTIALVTELAPGVLPVAAVRARVEVVVAVAGHTDYFDTDMYAQDQQIQSMTKQGLFNRLATVFFYLTDVEEGGETNFPRTDGLPQPSDFGDCSKGISVHPRRGRIIIFYSLHPSGKPDPYSLHAGCEVKQGTKWSANKWTQSCSCFSRVFSDGWLLLAGFPSLTPLGSGTSR